jgi:hypothetical protein
MSKETIRRVLAISQQPSPTHEAAYPPPYSPGTLVYIIIPELYTGPLDPDAPGGVATLFVARFIGRGES